MIELIRKSINESCEDMLEYGLAVDTTLYFLHVLWGIQKFHVARMKRNFATFRNNFQK